MRTTEDRVAGLIEQIRRDVGVLKGPREYVFDAAFFEERIAGCRATILELQAEPDKEK